MKQSFFGFQSTFCETEVFRALKPYKIGILNFLKVWFQIFTMSLPNPCFQTKMCEDANLSVPQFYKLSFVKMHPDNIENDLRRRLRGIL